MTNETTILARCRQGDLKAFRWIFDRYGDSLLRLGNRILGNREDAEDALQTTFIKLLRSISAFRGEAKFSTYLYRVHLRVCLDACRSRKQAMFLQLDGREACIHPDYELKMQLERAIAALPPRQKACFTLFAVEGMSQKEIAAVMNLAIGSVKANIFQARSKLRALLENDEKEIAV